jgi:hypothetical protein
LCQKKAVYKISLQPVQILDDSSREKTRVIKRYSTLLKGSKHEEFEFFLHIQTCMGRLLRNWERKKENLQFVLLFLSFYR